MMNPKALEALKKARELFAEKADDIPEQVTQPLDPQNNPLRKPRVVLLPPNAPKFDQHSMKEEHKKMEQPKQTDKYVDMSVSQAVKACIAKGIKRPADIAKETGKKVEQIYTAVWKIKIDNRKAKAQAKQQRQTTQQLVTPKQQAKEWDREPTPFEDAHMVVLKSREEYEKEIDRICDERNVLEKENAELRAVIKYLERKVMV